PIPEHVGPSREAAQGPPRSFQSTQQPPADVAGGAGQQDSSVRRALHRGNLLLAVGDVKLAASAERRGRPERRKRESSPEPLCTAGSRGREGRAWPNQWQHGSRARRARRTATAP